MFDGCSYRITTNVIPKQMTGSQVEIPGGGYFDYRTIKMEKKTPKALTISVWLAATVKYSLARTLFFHLALLARTSCGWGFMNLHSPKHARVQKL